jgi:hypothetical protein
MKSLVKRLGGLTFLLAAGTLLAQPAPAPTAQVPAGEMTTQMTGFVKDITEAHRQVQQLQIQARKDKDAIRLNCINDKLIQMKAVRNIFDEARNRFDAAQNQTEQTVQFEDSRTNWNKIRQLREQALACVGEVQFQSESKSGWQAPDIPDDPSKDDFPDHPEDPGYASPYN